MASTRRFLSTLISKIEIERKFLPTRLLLDALTRPTTALPTLPPSIRAHPAAAAVHFIRDVYYDRHDGRLTAEGLWVRRRSVFVASPTASSTATSTSSWEAKVRVGADSDSVATQFVEVEGAQAVEREIQRVLGGRLGIGQVPVTVTVDKITEHLGVMCDLTTRRVEGRLEVCYDESDEKDNEGQRLRNLTVAIDQVVETPRGDFAAARAVLERILGGRDGGGDGSDSDSNLTSPPDIFFHSIGELELMAEVRTDPDPDPPSFGDKNSLSKSLEAEHKVRRQTLAATRAAQLEAFMGAHPALFPMTPRPCGKLNAYFAWRAGAVR